MLGGHIYAVGGRDYSSELESVERYDPQTDTWEFTCPLKREVRRTGPVSERLQRNRLTLSHKKTVRSS